MEEKYLGVIFTGREIKMGCVSKTGQVTAPRLLSVQSLKRDEAPDLLADAIGNYLHSEPISQLAGIGLGMTGTFDRNRRWLSSFNANITRAVDICGTLSQRFHVPVIADNDMHAITCAVKHFDIGRITDNFIVLYVDTGVAAGIVCDGRIIRGCNNYSGEIGHMCVETDGEECSCGHSGCLEGIVSTHSLLDQARAIIPFYPGTALAAALEAGQLSISHLFDCAHRGDEAARRITARAIRALGVALINILNLLNPEHIVMTGTVGENPWLIEGVKDYIFRYCRVNSLNTMQGISASRFEENHRDICGAASLCFLDNC